MKQFDYPKSSAAMRSRAVALSWWLRTKLPFFVHEPLRRLVGLVLGGWAGVTQDALWVSSLRGLPYNSAGLPVPWFSAPAVQLLEAANLERRFVLEFGSGCSTWFWERKGCYCVSFETNPAWASQVRRGLKTERVEVVVLPEMPIRRAKADLAVIDSATDREAAARFAVEHTLGSGVIIVDNTDDPVATGKVLEILRFHGWDNRADYWGRPYGGHLRQCTSFFWRSNCPFLFSVYHCAPKEVRYFDKA